jgi:hypothetical protein
MTESIGNRASWRTVENVPTTPEHPVAGALGVSVVVPVFNSASTLDEHKWYA